MVTQTTWVASPNYYYISDVDAARPNTVDNAKFVPLSFSGTRLIVRKSVLRPGTSLASLGLLS
jgi:hypothetical protein